ncbi:UrcA family protein [Altererythrobacter xixiisoli]|uniref:UrcA family protein n=1 Tax=Croceibacterium xixiisoli TaxID=1476466 RepID=A0A6I4TWF9_9SPHN|nr:UrcA family protein [Croceibacterium xixiisoli]MXP00516.1 UrcA family protein [Croceibacterium xixiisoli]
MRNTNLARVLGCTITAALLGLGATSAAAAEADVTVSHKQADSRSINIQVADLDLSRSYDQRTLAIRIDNAARAVCDVNAGSTLDGLPRARACVSNAQAGALAQLDARGLNATAAVAAAGGMR